jgi:hypothetical protein
MARAGPVRRRMPASRLQIKALKAALATEGSAEIKIYPGAPHGFHADYRASYRRKAAENAWRQMQAWYKNYKVLGRRSLWPRATVRLPVAVRERTPFEISGRPITQRRCATAALMRDAVAIHQTRALAAATNALQLAIDGFVFGFDRGIAIRLRPGRRRPADVRPCRPGRHG